MKFDGLVELGLGTLQLGLSCAGCLALYNGRNDGHYERDQQDGRDHLPDSNILHFRSPPRTPLQSMRVTDGVPALFASNGAADNQPTRDEH